MMVHSEGCCIVTQTNDSMFAGIRDRKDFQSSLFFYPAFPYMRILRRKGETLIYRLRRFFYLNRSEF